MTFKERIYREKDNHTKIILYSDRGLFFNMVERSAYAFYSRIKPFKVHVKPLKGIEEPYVTLGFPVSKRDEYLQGLTVEEDGQGCTIAHLNEPIDENAYLLWKKEQIEQYNKSKEDTDGDITLFPSVVCEDAPVIKATTDETIIRQCFQDVKSLNIASITPMEAMLYLNQLQQKLKNVTL